MPLPTVSLTTLVARAREAADMPTSGFVADSATSLYAWINEGCQLLHEKLMAAYGVAYKASIQSITLIPGTLSYALENDFFKLISVDLNINGVQRALQPFTWAERNTYYNALSSWTGTPRYCVAGTSILVYPPTYSGVMSVMYCPIFWSSGSASSPAGLTTGTDTVFFPNGWEKYVVVYAAMRMRMKEESDVRELAAMLAKWDKELEELAINRDLGTPKSAVDVENIDIIQVL